MTPDVHIGPISRSQRPAAVRILAAAFDGDPVYRQLVPDGHQRARALGALFNLAVGDAARAGEVDVAAAGAQILGVAVWLPPGRFPLSNGRKLRSLPGVLALLRAAPRSFTALARLGASLESAHPSEPSWYLQALGVHPTAQGLGIGSRLLAVGLERAEHDGVPVTLETSVPAAARLYERHGFRTVRSDLHLVENGPPHQQMRRSLQAPRQSGPTQHDPQEPR